MANTTIDLKSILGGYSKEVEDNLFIVAQEVAKECLNDVKASSPVNNKSPRKGRYKRGWRLDLEKGFGTVNATIYNKTDYQLTHLLERPHAKKNQYGVWGTTYPKSEGNISKAEEKAIKNFEEQLTKKLGG